MTISEYFKFQAKLLEWEAPKGFNNHLNSYIKGDYMWLGNGMVIARIPLVSYVLDMPSLDSIGQFTTLPDEAVKGWLTQKQFKDKEFGVLVKAEAVDKEVWVRGRYIKLFGKIDKYDVWITPKALWLTEPKTRNVVGVIAGVRGIKI